MTIPAVAKREKQMAEEPRKKRAESLYDHDSSAKHRESRGEVKAVEREAGDAARERVGERDRTEGGETRRKPGEAKPREAKPRGGKPEDGGRKAERLAMHVRHEAERMKLHGDQRTDHREMHERHEAELAALDHAA